MILYDSESIQSRNISLKEKKVYNRILTNKK